MTKPLVAVLLTTILLAMLPAIRVRAADPNHQQKHQLRSVLHEADK